MNWRRGRGNSVDEIIQELGKKVDARLEAAFGENASSALIGMIKAEDQRGLQRLVDRGSWYDLIPDQVYLAVVSRNAAAYQGKFSRGVSLKTLYGCLDSICKDVQLLYIQSYRKFIERIVAASAGLQRFKQEAEKAGLDKYSAANLAENAVGMCASYVDGRTAQDIPAETRRFLARKGKGYANILFGFNTNTPDVFRKIFGELRTIKCSETDENLLIAKISKIIDVAHYRGSLAGVFVEGGASTCAKASNLAPDEVYESRRDAAVEYWAHMLDDCRF